MRVLLEQECAAVAGGDRDDCEKKMKALFTAGGAVAGGLSGAGAFSIPGAIVGASAGGLTADMLGPMICAAIEQAEAAAEEGDVEYDPAIIEGFIQQLVAWSQRSVFPNSYGHNPTGPHELVVDTSSY